MATNGIYKKSDMQETQSQRANETEKVCPIPTCHCQHIQILNTGQLLDTVKDLVVDFVRTADSNASISTGQPAQPLLDFHPPAELEKLLDFRIPDDGQGLDGVCQTARSIQKYSVNIWDQGFLDKLYHSPSPIGLAADLLLASLNTNVHTFSVAPALTIVEKRTTRALASMFGFHGRFAGGISQCVFLSKEITYETLQES